MRLALTLCLSAVAPAASADPLLVSSGPSRWVLRLAAPDPEARAGAAWLLGRYTTDFDHDNLGPTLAQALTRESDPRVMMALVGALAAGDSIGQGRALRGLFNEGRIAALGVSTAVGAVALRALGQYSDEESLRLLINAARTGPSGALRTDITEAAALALADQPDGAFSAAITLASTGHGVSQDRAAMLLAVALRGDPRNARMVYEQLTGPGRTGTLAAIDATVRMNLVEHAPALVELARNARERNVRRAAVRALGVLGGGFDPGVLVGWMADPVTRDVAIEAAGALGDPARVPDLARWLDAEWAGDRAAAAEALGAIGGAAAMEALTRGLAREASPAVREGMWQAVARVGGARAAAALRGAPDEPGVQWARVELALREGLRASGPAAGTSAAAVRVRAWTEGVAVEGLSSAAADVRAATATALGDAHAGSEALAARLGREDDEGVRVALVQALGQCADPAARGALVALVARECDAPTVAAVVAAGVLAGLGEAAAAPWVRRMGGASWPEARAVARWSSGVLHDPAAIGALEAAVVMEPDAQARGAAVIALARLWGPGADEAVRWAQRTAWSVRMDAMVDYARTITRGGGRAVATGSAVVRLTGAPARSVWAVEMPDGGMRFGVAAEDGVVLIAGVPSARVPLRRVDVARQI